MAIESYFSDTFNLPNREYSIKPRSTDVLGFVMAGGKGSRLKVLTKYKCKPAVSIFGRYKIFDFVASNVVNSGIDIMLTATQFESESLHQHIRNGGAWGFDKDGKILEIIDPRFMEQDINFDGTADSVRKSSQRIDRYMPSIVLVLGSDHIYSMDYNKAIKQHLAKDADVTIMANAVPDNSVSNFGIMKIDESGRIIKFAEKPKDRELIEEFRLSPEMKEKLGITDPSINFLASMGNYVFFWERLKKFLEFPGNDFGNDIIPSIEKNSGSLYAYVFNGYWRDVGKIGDYFNCNMEFAHRKCHTDFTKCGLKTNEDHKDLIQINAGTSFLHSVISPGDVIGKETSIVDSVLGSHVTVNEGCKLENCVFLGKQSNGFYKAIKKREEHSIYVGKNSKLNHVILDENIIIGNNVDIGPHNGSPEKRTEILRSLGLEPFRELKDGTIHGDFYIDPKVGILVIGRPEKNTDRKQIIPNGVIC